MSTGANAAQQEYWNSVAGPRWVGLAGYVEKRVERINDLLLVRSAVAPGEKVLEVGCGTGAATVPLAEAVGDTGEVVGIDISEPMLAAARERISQSGLRNITLLQCGRAGSRLRAPTLRPDRVALWRDVLCRSGSRLPKPARCDASRRAAVLCVLGSARGKSALADPLRNCSPAFGTTGAKASPCTGACGFRRAGIPALRARTGGVREHRDPARDARDYRREPSRRRPSTPASWVPRAG